MAAAKLGSVRTSALSNGRKLMCLFSEVLSGEGINYGLVLGRPTAHFMAGDGRPSHHTSLPA